MKYAEPQMKCNVKVSLFRETNSGERKVKVAGVLLDFSASEVGLSAPMEKSLLLVQLKVHTANLFWPAAL